MEKTMTHILKVPAEHACYAHHFPGVHIVPAALFLDWLIASIGEYFPDYCVSSLKTMKFLAVVEPGDECSLDFYHDAKKNSVTVNAYRRGVVLCRGTLNLENAP